jgi:hypothetical protein
MPTPQESNLCEARRVIESVRTSIVTAANVPQDVEDLALRAQTDAATAFAGASEALGLLRHRAEQSLTNTINRLASTEFPGQELAVDVGRPGFNILERRAHTAIQPTSTFGNCMEMAMLAFENLRNAEVGPVELVGFSADWACVAQYTGEDRRVYTFGTSPGWPSQGAAANAANSLRTILAHPAKVSPIGEHLVPRQMRRPELWRWLENDAGAGALRIRDPAAFDTVVNGEGHKDVIVRHYDHMWIMIGRDVRDQAFEYENPQTWGPDAVWCDPWQRIGDRLGRCYAVADWVSGTALPVPSPQYFLDTPEHVRDGDPSVHSSCNGNL